ncbi:MAG: polyphosphate kinase 1 [Gemmataceae bacterium]
MIIAHRTASQIALDDPQLYLNRELSWLEFNRRVLAEAQDPTVPLLERIKFSAIFAANLDEFFMVRVGGILQKLHAGVRAGWDADRMPLLEQLRQIRRRTLELLEEQYRVFHRDLLPALQGQGVHILTEAKLTESDRRFLAAWFRKRIYPVLTPLAIDPGHPFPQLPNRSLNLVVLLRRRDVPEPLFAVVQVPPVVPRLVELPCDSGSAFVFLEEVVRMYLPELFLGMEVVASGAFRILRDREYELEDEAVEDLLKTIEEELKRRRRSAPVRLDVEASLPSVLIEFLEQVFDLDDQDVYRLPGPLDLSGMTALYELPGYETLRDAPFVPQPVAEFTRAPNIWAAIRARDILVHHPYESFSHVVDFIESAAADERVLAIKMTLYRAGTDSPIIRALQEAADRGKQVTVLVELKARMDEEWNIRWAKELEQSGVHVVFGFVMLKTHCKVALVVRQEEDGLRRYVHLSTGNYNPQTARVYTDLGFFTCRDDFGEDVSALFNYLTGYSEAPRWRKLIVAPTHMLQFFLERIEREIAFQQQGLGGRIIAKVNAIVEPAVMKALYRASQAGVEIDLICRGICCLRPGVPGVSDRIRVISILDRFLEHSRVFYFGGGGNPEVFIGSADWMDRNLKRRVEVVFPIEQEDLKKRLVEEVLALCLADNVKAWEMMPDGSYRRRSPENQPKVRSQERFLELAKHETHRPVLEPGILAPAWSARGGRGDADLYHQHDGRT